MIIDRLYKNLVDALQLVAAPADEQIKLLPGYPKAAEELVLIFSDAYISVPQLVVHNRVTEETALLLDELDRQFEALAENERMWSNEQLKNAAEWKGIREMAGKILKEVKES